MSLEKVLLLFDGKRPFWTSELIQLAGEEPSTLHRLEQEGLLKKESDGFVLSEAGRERFRQWARESWLDAEPGGFPEDLKLERNRLETALRFDNGFRGFHGSKEIFITPELPFFPNLQEDRLYNVTPGGIQWLFPSDPLVEEMVERFPRQRQPEETDLTALKEWKKQKNIPVGTFVPDLLLAARRSDGPSRFSQQGPAVFEVFARPCFPHALGGPSRHRPLLAFSAGQSTGLSAWMLRCRHS
jgi:hypothetical protein